jgi:4-amino-4-deoxy-L-arabinose transferase-like glycosyltransferase
MALLAPLLISLPIIAFVCLWYVATLSERTDWRLGFLKAAIVWGVLALLITELLSAVTAVYPATLALAWAIVIAVSLYLSQRHLVATRENPLSVARRLFAWPPGERWWLVPIVPAVMIAVTTAAIALIAPPNTWDSMTYHMSRVEHWRLHHSVAHYPTNIEWQLFLNPWAEFAILQFQTLGFGSDRLANMVQWFAFVGSMVGVSLLVRILGGALFAQGLGVLLVATTPMIILQSTSTQNDLVCGFFVVAAAYFFFERLATSSRNHEIYSGLSAALAIATKGTAYPILFPFVAYALIGVTRQENLRRGFQLAGVLILSMLLMNAWHWARNFGLWHHPLGDPKWVAQYKNEVFGVREIASNVVRSVAGHLGTPSWKVNAFTESVVANIHGALRISVNEPSVTIQPGRSVPDIQYFTHEDYAGNGIMVLLAAMTIGLAILTQARTRIRPFAVLLLMSGLLFCVFFKWTPFNNRVHTPLFLLAAAAVGCVLTPLPAGCAERDRGPEKKRALFIGLSLIASGLIMNEWMIAWLFNPSGAMHSQPLRVGIGAIDILLVGYGCLMIVWHRQHQCMLAALMVAILMVAAVPWVVLNKLRPLISTEYAPSIFDRSRIEQMFANNKKAVLPYTELVSMLTQLVSCREIGLKIQIGAFEYPLWQIARHAGADLTFYHVGITNESAKIKSVKTTNRSTEPIPCAITVIGYEEQWNPDLSGFETMHPVWARPPIRLLVRDGLTLPDIPRSP